MRLSINGLYAAWMPKNGHDVDGEAVGMLTILPANLLKKYSIRITSAS